MDRYSLVIEYRTVLGKLFFKEVYSSSNYEDILNNKKHLESITTGVYHIFELRNNYGTKKEKRDEGF